MIKVAVTIPSRLPTKKVATAEQWVMKISWDSILGFLIELTHTHPIVSRKYHLIYSKSLNMFFHFWWRSTLLLKDRHWLFVHDGGEQKLPSARWAMLWAVQAGEQQWDDPSWAPAHSWFVVCQDTGHTWCHNLQSTIPSPQDPVCPRRVAHSQDLPWEN